MLGHAIVGELKDWRSIGWDIKELDITNEREVLAKIGKLKPQMIINCAAYTNVDKAEEEKGLAFKVNAEGVKNLAKAAVKTGAILIHYSTDYVFDGKKKEGYTEDDIPSNPVNIYGASKLQGEEELFLASKNLKLKTYLIRSSWLFGPNGKNFVQTIINLLTTNSQLRIVNDQHGKPTYTKDLAKSTKQLIEEKAPFGIYHLVNEPATTWYEYAKEILKLSKFHFDSSYSKILPVSSDGFPRPAKRPPYSILLNTKRPLLRPWKEALEDYLTNDLQLTTEKTKG